MFTAINFISINNMHIGFVCGVQSRYSSPEELLATNFTTNSWAKALAQRGIKVSLFYRFHKSESFSSDGVNYYFVKDDFIWKDSNWNPVFKFHLRVARLITDLDINIVHTHNTHGIVPNYLLRKLISNRVIVVQDHSGSPPNTKLLSLLKYSLCRMDAVMFSAKGQEQTWVDSGIVSDSQCVFLMENSSPFSFRDRVSSRKESGMVGKPIFLWVGNLNKNKDPLTALRAFKKIIHHQPEAHLYMIYRFDDMEDEVEKFISETTELVKKVTLIGRVERDDLGKYYNSADYILSASYKEGSGYSVIEAMSCGVVPILTDIPSFRDLTHSGQVGTLYPAGDVDMLYERIKEKVELSIEEQSSAVLSHFKSNFSYEALARGAEKIYTQILSRAGSKTK